MEALNEVYDMGVDYVDITGETEEDGQDTVTLRFNLNYTEENLNPDFNSEDNNEKEERKIKKLSDEDLNQLL